MAEHTHLRIDAATKERLKELARQQGKSMSQVIRDLVEGASGNPEPEGEWSELDSWWGSAVSTDEET
jgi:hypothetical protein